MGMTWIWPIRCLLGLSQRAQETWDQILLTGTLCGTPSCSKKCLSLCLYPAWLKALTLNPSTREARESVGVTCPAASTKVARRSVYKLGSQSCFSAICRAGRRCRGSPLLALRCWPVSCLYGLCTAELAHLGSGCCSGLSALSHAMAQPMTWSLC